MKSRASSERWFPEGLLQIACMRSWLDWNWVRSRSRLFSWCCCWCCWEVEVESSSRRDCWRERLN
jgi:hypothetical protein